MPIIRSRRTRQVNEISSIKSMDKTIVISILKNAEDTLQTAIYGLEDVKTQKGQRRFSGIRNLVVFGRSVSFAIQNLRGKVEGFDEWYAPHQERMAQDKVMKFFLELRNTILKVGDLKVGVRVKGGANIDDILKAAPKPPGAIGMFIGDNFGGSGWLIPMPDGSTEKFYVDLPKNLVNVENYFTQVPEKFRDEIEPKDIELLGEEYINKLQMLIDDCRAAFLEEATQTYGPSKKRLPPFMKIVK